MADQDDELAPEEESELEHDEYEGGDADDSEASQIAPEGVER